MLPAEAVVADERREGFCRGRGSGSFHWRETDNVTRGNVSQRRCFFLRKNQINAVCNLLCNLPKWLCNLVVATRHSHSHRHHDQNDRHHRRTRQPRLQTMPPPPLQRRLILRPTNNKLQNNPPRTSLLHQQAAAPSVCHCHSVQSSRCIVFGKSVGESVAGGGHGGALFGCESLSECYVGGERGE
jgi:hypothetical protein